MAFPTRNCTPTVFVFNTTWDEEEDRWKAGQFRELKRDAPYFQAAFRVRLANRLQDLGFGVERKRDDFEIAGIPADVLKRFSRRTALIEKLAEEKGISDPDRKAELGAETREKKGQALSWEALRKEWNARLSDRGTRGAGGGSPPRAACAPGRRRARRPAVDHAIEHSFVREAVVPERKLLTEALKRGLGSVTVEGVTREVETASADPQRGRRPHDGDDERDAGPGIAADRLRPQRAGAVPAAGRSRAAMLPRLVQRRAKGSRAPCARLPRPGDDYPRRRRNGQNDARTGDRRGSGRGRAAGGCSGPVGEGQPGSAAAGSRLRQCRHRGQVPEGRGDAGIGQGRRHPGR